MRIEQEFINFIDEFADSPLPSIRGGCESARTIMSYHSDDSFSGDEFPDDFSLAETDEGRLSRSLQSWMPDHVIRTLEPREKPNLEPLFSGKLGKERPVLKKQRNKAKTSGNRDSQKRGRAALVKRSDSEESLVTNLSLLTCSSGCSLSKIVLEPPKDKRRRRRKLAPTPSSEDSPFVSKWVEFAKKHSGGRALHSFMRTHNVLTSGTGGYTIGADGYGQESEPFQNFEKDEQDAVFQTGRRTGIKFINKESLKRSSSMSTIKVDAAKPKAAVPRVLSASATKARGKPIDLEEIKRERMNRLIAIEQAKYQEKERLRRKRASLGRRSSSKSVADSSTTNRPVSPPTTIAPSVFSAKTQSGHSSEHRPGTPSDKQSDSTEERVTVWKGDREILEIDLKRELTHRVKNKIASTRSALTRVSGLGDSNEKKTIVGTHDEFPKHTEDDFCHRPRIIQKMRISPQLSGVIHDDIQVRMGRPRYHEIRVTDLQQWNKGQKLNKAHTNLKVFNWLHSLRESDFGNKVTEEVLDEVPDEENLRGVDFQHVEAADEPEVKPLYRAYEVRLL